MSHAPLTRGNISGIPRDSSFCDEVLIISDDRV